MSKETLYIMSQDEAKFMKENEQLFEDLGREIKDF
jgi:hypothetical protein